MTGRCLNCGSEPTIKAHLMPRVLAKEVQPGKAHAVMARRDTSFLVSQSGLYDRAILCKLCDGRIGNFENYAAGALGLVRQAAATTSLGHCTIEPFDSDRFLRFCAGLLWKYSVTRRAYGRISLGPYQALIRAIAFDDADIPAAFDAVLFRLKLHPTDDAIFAYRAPLLDRKGSINLVRFMSGGCVVFVRVDQRPLAERLLEPCWIRGKSILTFLVAPAQTFEEFTKARRLTAGIPGLSSFIDKQTPSG